MVSRRTPRTGGASPRQIILLAPTSRHFDAVCQDLLERARAGFFPLEANLRLMPGGHLQSSKIPGELFAHFSPDPESEPDEDLARHAFALVNSSKVRSRRRP